MQVTTIYFPGFMSMPMVSGKERNLFQACRSTNSIATASLPVMQSSPHPAPRKRLVHRKSERNAELKPEEPTSSHTSHQPMVKTNLIFFGFPLFVPRFLLESSTASS